MDADAAGERPSKSVAFQFDNAGGVLSSVRCDLFGVSDAGQSFQVVADRMILIMVHLNWNPLPQGELTRRVGGGFMKVQESVYLVLPELHSSMVWVLGAQIIIRAILQELF